MRYPATLALFLPFPLVAATVNLDVRVADELGRPLAGAEVSCEWVPRLSPDPWNQPHARERAVALADERGRARLGGRHVLDHLAVTARAEGHYAVTRRLPARSQIVRLALLPQGAPVRSARIEVLTSVLPRDGTRHAFDLEMGAFVAPLGVGRHADVLLSGVCPSSELPAGSRAVFRDTLRMEFVAPRSGQVATPRPGQEGFAQSIQPFLEGLLLHGIEHPLEAPGAGYQAELTYLLARTAEAPPPGDLAWVRPAPGIVPAPGRVGSPQWIFRIRPGPAALHGVITDFGWMEDGRLRLRYRISLEPGNPSLEFDAPER
jgi:hypothetical protein